MNNLNYPKEWDELSKKERKKKLKELKRKKAKQQRIFKKVRNITIFLFVLAGVFVAYRLATKKTPEEIVFEKKVEEVNLEGRVETLELEGARHISPGQEVSYKTNPPASGPHWTSPVNWGFYNRELSDSQVIHNLEHGGIWITYKDLENAEIDRLKSIVKKNSKSVVANKRSANEYPVVVVSWRRMMRLDTVDEVAIQKFIDTYKNQSPEKLAR